MGAASGIEPGPPTLVIASASDTPGRGLRPRATEAYAATPQQTKSDSLRVMGGIENLSVEPAGDSYFGISSLYHLVMPLLWRGDDAVTLDLVDAPEPWALQLESEAVRAWERLYEGRKLVYRHRTVLIDWSFFARAPEFVMVEVEPGRSSKSRSPAPREVSWVDLDEGLLPEAKSLFDPSRAKLRTGPKGKNDRLPEVEVSYPYRLELAELDTLLRLNLARFEDSGESEVPAFRYDSEFKVSRRFERGGWYSRPSLTMNYTQYDFANSTRADLERSLPVWELDNGWVFEQPIASEGEALVQTVEPRIYYLYVPHVDQTRLPRRDVVRRPFGLGGLFNQYRLMGRDRIGDANQASFGVTTRLISDTHGVEYLRADLAQTLYFSERRIEMNAVDEEPERNFSDIASSLAAQVGGVELNSTLRWDTAHQEVSTASTRLSHAINSRAAVSVSHLKYRETKEAEFRVQWLLNPAWGVQSSVRHILGDEQLDAVLAGFQYRGCGFSVMLDSQRAWSEVADEHHYSVDLMFAVDAMTGFTGLRCR